LGTTDVIFTHKETRREEAEKEARETIIAATNVKVVPYVGDFQHKEEYELLDLRKLLYLPSTRHDEQTIGWTGWRR